MLYSRVTRTKLIYILCFIAIGIVILGSIEKQMRSKTSVEGRLPNQTLYSDLLNCNPNSLNLTSPAIPKETKVIVIVCSKPDDIETRMTIRQTWANALFSKAVENKLVSVFFLVGTGLDEDVIDNEQKSFSDILQVKVYDTYTNLVYKLLAAYRWIHPNYPGKFVLKIDSDVVVLLDRIVSRVGSPRKRTIQCYVHKSPQPVRNSESPWYIPESVYPEHFLPDYCSGPLYLLTPAALQAILEASRDAMVFEVEDAFFTGLLAKKGLVELRREPGVWNHWKSSQPCVDGEGIVISFPVHGASSTTLLQFWEHLSHLRCRRLIEHFLLSLIEQD